MTPDLPLLDHLEPDSEEWKRELKKTQRRKRYAEQKDGEVRTYNRKDPLKVIEGANEVDRWGEFDAAVKKQSQSSQRRKQPARPAGDVAGGSAAIQKSLEEPIIDPALLARASADPVRIQAELAEFHADPDGYITRRFTELAEWDFPSWCAINAKIQNKKGQRSPLLLWRAQRKIWQWLLEDLASGKPVRWICCKARQEGLSTEFLALILWICSMREDRNALVVSYDSKSTKGFNSRVRSMHAQSHPLLRPETLGNDRETLHFGAKTTARQRGEGVGLDSRIIFATAGTDELGRSWNFHVCFLSEVGIWPSKKIDFEEQLGALNHCVANLPGTCIFMESTFKGENAVAKFFRNPSNGYRKIFISWCASDEYRRPLRPGESLGHLSDSEEGSKFGNEVAESRLIREELKLWYDLEYAAGGEEWMSAEISARLNWRRWAISELCLGSLRNFYQEYPTCPAHAMSSSGKNCFDSYSLELLRRAVAEEGLTPERFNYVHDPENDDIEQKFAPNPHGQLIVWKWPDPDGSYVLSADSAQGIPNSGDHSAALVLRVDDGLEEVASFSSILTPDRFSELLFWLGLIYAGRDGAALLIPEDNEKGGFFVCLDLDTRLHYPRLYRRYDAYDKKAATRPGYNVKGGNKSVLVSDVQKRIFDHEVFVRTEALLDQLTFYQQLDNGDLGAPPGHRDDLVSTLLLGVHGSTKVHFYLPAPEGPPKGSLAWWMKRQEQRHRPGLFGNYR